MATQLSNSSSNTACGVFDSVSFIAGLLVSVRPFAVCFAIFLFCINTINGHTSRTFPHVFKEIVKRIQPSLTYFDASSAVDIEINGFRVFASSNHTSPRIVCFISYSDYCVPVPYPAASARFCVPRNQSIVPNRYLLTAYALANARMGYCATGIEDWISDSNDVKLAKIPISDVYLFRGHNDECSLFLSSIGVRFKPHSDAPSITDPIKGSQLFSKCIGSLGLSRKGGSRSFWFPATARFGVV